MSAHGEWEASRTVVKQYRGVRGGQNCIILKSTSVPSLRCRKSFTTHQSLLLQIVLESIVSLLPCEPGSQGRFKSEDRAQKNSTGTVGVYILQHRYNVTHGGLAHGP